MIRSLESFRGAVSPARSPAEWQDALLESLVLEANTEPERLARQRIAREHEWWRLTGQIAELIATGVEHPEVERIRTWVAARIRE